MAFGYVYILVNDSLPYLKIGYTTRSPETRASELTSTGIPTAFRVAYKLYIENCEQIEKLIHTELRQFRVSANREFFQIDLTTAVSKIESVINKVDLIEPEIGRDCPNFDAEEYIRNLASKKEIQAQEKTFYINSNLELAKAYYLEVYSILERINGTVTKQGFKIIFSLLAEPDCLEIKATYSIPELPDSFNWCQNILYFFAGDEFESKCVKSPQYCAKTILDDIEWPTEDEHRTRLNPPIEFKEALRKGWEKYLIEEKIEKLTDLSKDEVTDLVEYFLDDFWDSFCVSLCRKYQLAEIIAISWRNFANPLTYSDDTDEATGIFWKYFQSQIIKPCKKL